MGIARRRPKCAAGWDRGFGCMAFATCDRHQRPTISCNRCCSKSSKLCGPRLRESDKLAHFVLGTCRMVVVELRRASHRQEALLAKFGSDLIPEPPPLPTLDDRQLALRADAQGAGRSLS